MITRKASRLYKQNMFSPISPGSDVSSGEMGNQIVRVFQDSYLYKTNHKVESRIHYYAENMGDTTGMITFLPDVIEVPCDYHVQSFITWCDDEEYIGYVLPSVIYNHPITSPDPAVLKLNLVPFFPFEAVCDFSIRLLWPSVLKASDMYNNKTIITDHSNQIFTCNILQKFNKTAKNLKVFIVKYQLPHFFQTPPWGGHYSPSDPYTQTNPTFTLYANGDFTLDATTPKNITFGFNTIDRDDIIGPWQWITFIVK